MTAASSDACVAHEERQIPARKLAYLPVGKNNHSNYYKRKTWLAVQVEMKLGL
jgi:hypothetical protein